MESYFGGRPGQPFEIKQVFTSYHGSTNSIDADLSKGWTSPIQVGEFVCVSYGEPGTDEYNTYRNIDLQSTEGKAHNWTLWRKAYDDSYTSAGGLYYELIGSMTGNTPNIVVETPATVVASNIDPGVEYDNSNTDEPHIIFSLPRSQQLQYDAATDFSTTVAGTAPTFELDSSDVDNPRIKVTLPLSQMLLAENVTSESIVAELDPYIEFDSTSDPTYPTLKFYLPLSQRLLTENVTSEKLDANLDPYIEFDGDTNPTYPTLTFYLPQSQVMDEPTLVSIGPAETPSVEDIGTVNSPKLQFSLPRAVQFYYGSLLGERTAGTYSVTNDAFSDYEIGDYYINAATGFVYKVTAKDGTTCEFTYMACIQSPLPTTIATGISPYTAEGELAAPEVVQSYTNNEQTAWQLEFKLPKAAVPLLETEFVGSTEQAAASLAITSEDNYTISLTIPTGSKLFTGTEVTADTLTASIDGARVGDIYLNSSTGVVYELTDSGWTASSGNLKGPVGDALNVVLYRTYSYSDGVTKDQIPSLLVTEMTNAGLTTSSSSIISVVYTNDSGEEESFWYVWAADATTGEYAWRPKPLTGGVGSLLQDSYTVDTTKVDDKSYTVAYINTLINSDAPGTETGERTAYSKSKIDSLISALETTITSNKESADTSISEANSAIAALETKVDADITNLSDNYYDKTTIESKETTINASITSLQDAITWGKFSDLIES